MSDTPTPLRPCCSIIFDDDREEDRGVADGLLAGVGDSEGEDDDEDVPVEEAMVPKTARAPTAPTRAEWQAHQSTHLPYRSWCPECVAGRKDNPGHRTMPSEERLVPEVSLDYAFVRRGTDEDKAKILVVKDRETKAIMAAVLQMKGACLEEAGEKGVELISKVWGTRVNF